jgi:uncharacterized protein (TIGR03437 family)
VDALDYNGLWKLADALMEFAFDGTGREFALDGDDPQITLGAWSDGRPVKALFLRPTLSIQGIVNAASLRPGPISPGGMITLIGAGLGPRAAEFLQTDANNMIRKNLAGMQVSFQGILSPVIFSSMNRASVLVPYAVAALSSVTVQLQYNNFASEPITLTVAPSNVGVFTMNSSGVGQATVVNQNSTLNSTDNGATVGSLITIYATGLGLPDQPGIDGRIAMGISARPSLPITVTIGGSPAEIVYAGEAPAMAGVFSIVARVPSDLAAGSHALTVTAGASASQPDITVAVR